MLYMRKLSTLLGVASFALGAFAALPTGTSFETSSPLGEAQPLVIDADDLDGIANERYWVTEAQGYELEADVTPYGDDGYDGNRPEKFSGSTKNINHLAVDGDAKPLYRAISTVAGSDLSKVETLEKATTGIDDGLYIDTLVQFTVADAPAPADEAGVKFAIWVQTDDEADEPSTNFVVQAGYYSTASRIVSANYAMAAIEGFDYNAWHRLTVKAISDIGNGGPGFVVFVDEILLNRADPDPSSLGAITLGNKVNARFRGAVLPSMIGSGIYKNTISAVGFSGKGNVDDVSFTATAPEFATDSIVYSATWGEGVAGVTCGEESIEASTEYPVPEGGTFQLVVAYEDGFMPGEPEVNGVKIIGSEAGSSGGGVTVTYTFEKATTSGASIVFTAFEPTVSLDVGGEKSYHRTLAEAFAATKSSGGTIRLSGDTTIDDGEEAMLADDVTVVVDLAGHTITGSESMPMFVVSGGGLVITNSTESIGRVVAGEGGWIWVSDGGTTEVYGGKFAGAFFYDNYEEGSISDVLTVYAGTFDKASWTDDEIALVADENSTVYGPPVYAEYIVVAGDGDEPEAPRYEFTVAAIDNTSVSYTIGEGEAQSEAGTVQDLLGGTEVTVTYTPSQDYKIVDGEATKTYTVGEDGDTTSAGQVTVVAKDYVVSVMKGDEPVVKYESLQEAIDANDGEEFEATLLANIEEAVTISGETTISLVEGEFTFSGTFAGAGTVAMASAPKAASADRFAETWEGTFVLDWEITGATGDNFTFNSYGIEGSTVEVKKGYTGWLTVGTTILPKVKVTGDLLLNNGASGSTNATFNAVTGSGTFTGSHPYVSYTKWYRIISLDKFTGTLASGSANHWLAIDDIIPAEEPTYGKPIVKCAETIAIYDLASTTIDGAKLDVCLDTLGEQKGIYLAAASVEIAGTTKLFGSVENALDAAEAANAISVVVYDTASVVEREGWSYSEGVYTQTRTVAMVGETPYPSLAGAIEAAVAGGTADVLLVDGTSEAVTIPEGITVSVADDVVFSGKLSGCGSIRYTKAPASFNKANLLAADWTGTYVADYQLIGSWNLNAYGTAISYVEVADVWAGWYIDADWVPTLRVSGMVEMSNGTTTKRITIPAVTGDGVFVFSNDKNYTIVNLEDWNGVLSNQVARAGVQNIVSGAGKVVYATAPNSAIGAPAVGDGFEGEVVLAYNWGNVDIAGYSGDNSTLVFNDMTGYFAESNGGSDGIKGNVRIDGNVVINNGWPTGAGAWDNTRCVKFNKLAVEGSFKLDYTGSGNWSGFGLVSVAALNGDGKGAITVGNDFCLKIDAVDFAKTPSGTGVLVAIAITGEDISTYIKRGRLYGPDGTYGDDVRIPVTVKGEATEKYLVYDAKKGGLVLEGAESELPTVDGEEVATEEVFDAANSTKDIVYPSEPALEGEEGSQTITFGGVTLDVPSYYTATLDGNTVSLKLNDNAIPEIGATEASGEVPAIPAMVVADDEVAVGLTSTDAKLWYGLATCDTPNGDYADPDPSTLTQGTGAAMALTATREEGEAVKFYRVYVTDIAP